MSTKISALPPSAGLVLTDIFPVVDDPGGTPATQRASLSQLSTVLSGDFVLKSGDTMTGSLVITGGELTLDNNRNIRFLDSVAVARNIVNLDAGDNLNISGSNASSDIRFRSISTGAVFASVKSNSQFQISDGAEGAPGLAFLNDPDTGFYRPAANQIALSVGATQVFTQNVSQSIFLTDIFVNAPGTTINAPLINASDTLSGGALYSSFTLLGFWGAAIAQPTLALGSTTDQVIQVLQDYGLVAP